MKIIRSIRVVALMTLVCFASSGCMSIRPVHLPSSERPNYQLRIKPGRTVVARMRDGTVHRFELVRQEPDALVGEDVRVPIAEIAALEVERINQLRTSVAIGAGGFALLILILSTI